MLSSVSQLAKKIFPAYRSMRNSKEEETVYNSSFISRDLSWLQFNYRVLDQARQKQRVILERLKFLAISSSNLDEFFTIRVGSLYNYLDYSRERIDYSGLNETKFKSALLGEAMAFYQEQCKTFQQELRPNFRATGFDIIGMSDLNEVEQDKVFNYFKKTIFPMLTPMLLDLYHTFPVLLSKSLVFGVVTQSLEDSKNPRKLSFVQIPNNLPRFVEIERDNLFLFLPIEDLVRAHIDKLFRNVRIEDVNLFRITRNGDISIDESDEIEADFAEEVRRKLHGRRTGRVVRVEIQDNHNTYLINTLRRRWEIDYENIFISDSLIDFTALWQIVNHRHFKEKMPQPHNPVEPLSLPTKRENDLFEVLREQDILLHHPYNDMELVLQLLEQAAEDPNVLSIKLTIYRLAKNSRIIEALLKAAENGKYVSALFEVKARFDEENNIREAKRLQKAGCFVIYGIGRLKTHTKLMLIVRKEGNEVTRYVHMSSGNYNETTAKIYTDISLLTTNEVYANDVSEFFNVITGHSHHDGYQYLITAPRDMRRQLSELIRAEADNAKQGLPSGIIIKVNSLEDKAIIEELYKASSAGVPIELIIRGICCLRPQRTGLSDNIRVRSIVGDLLEHTRLYYFHAGGEGKIYSGSADMMNRSFDRRIESLFLMADNLVKREAMNILRFNLKDNVNAYEMQEDGSYIKLEPTGDDPKFNIHKAFFKLRREDIDHVSLFD